MSHHPLDGYSKYERAKKVQPASATLARHLFDYCAAKHKNVDGGKLSLRPEGDSGVIVSEPNYFAYVAINVKSPKIVVDLNPSRLLPYERAFSASELAEVKLKTRGKKANRVQIEIRSETQLQAAYKILDFCHKWVRDHRRAKMGMEAEATTGDANASSPTIAETARVAKRGGRLDLILEQLNRMERKIDDLLQSRK
jgi:hypothetical protein